jgi:hypothetical protein
VRRAAIALVLAMAGAAVAHLHVSTQSYVPVIRIASPDGVTFTTRFDPRAEWRSCAEANRRFLDPLRQRCPACEVVFARCERALDEPPLPAQAISAPGLQIAIAGPAARAKQSCDRIAADFTRRGVQARSGC